MTTQREKAQLLRELYLSPELLNLVNVWDVASAHVVAAAPGTTAIATASAAIAATHGYEDGENIPLDLHLAAIRRIADAVEFPVTADLERGYGDVFATVAAAIAAGVVGANLEDDLCPIETMQQRVRDAVAAGETSGIPFVVNARTDVFLERSDRPEEKNLAEAISRGRAYLDAGADCVFVPGCRQESSIRELVAALGRGRVSLLAVAGLPSVPVLEELGVARLSHGPYPHRQSLAALSDYQQKYVAARIPSEPTDH